LNREEAVEIRVDDWRKCSSAWYAWKMRKRGEEEGGRWGKRGSRGKRRKRFRG
jgi:hypothetical protein